MPGRVTRWLCFGALLLGCSCKRSANNQPKPTASSPRKILLSLPLSRETKTGAIDGAILHTQVNGHDSLWLVDTGATNSVLALWFAKSIGVNLEPTTQVAIGVDGATALAGVATQVNLTIGSITSTNGRFPVVRVPQAIEEMGIGGFFSPQALAVPGTSVIIDFRQSRLVLLDGAIDPSQGQGHGVALAPKGMRACPADEKHAAPRYLVEASIAAVDCWLELDTGALESRVTSDSDVGRKLMPTSEPAHAASLTGAHAVRRAKQVAMKIGERALSGSVLIVSGPTDAGCQSSGAVGMDVLKDCVVALDAQTGLARCW